MDPKDPEPEHWYTFHHSSKIKSWKSQKTVEVKVYLTIFAWRWKDLDPDPYLLKVTNRSKCVSGMPKKQTDPEHWLLLFENNSSPYTSNHEYFGQEHQFFILGQTYLSVGWWEGSRWATVPCAVAPAGQPSSLFLKYNFIMRMGYLQLMWEMGKKFMWPPFRGQFSVAPVQRFSLSSTK